LKGCYTIVTPNDDGRHTGRPQVVDSVDGQGRSRTADTAIFSRVLYQLSYLAGNAVLADRWQSIGVANGTVKLDA
jgi:hypothetical protein